MFKTILYIPMDEDSVCNNEGPTYIIIVLLMFLSPQWHDLTLYLNIPVYNNLCFPVPLLPNVFVYLLRDKPVSPMKNRCPYKSFCMSDSLLNVLYHQRIYNDKADNYPEHVGQFFNFRIFIECFIHEVKKTSQFWVSGAIFV